MIERQSVLDLIGRYKNRYTSCIITSYTIDFGFFEERLMSILRLSDVKNVNVFLDGKYLENYFENSNGNEFKTHKTYSLNPIYLPGVFHSKIMLLTGAKHGLLIIGSGNLTSSGLSANDEIWGAFHLNSVESVNASLFATVWNYLQQYLIQAKGFNAQKINWVLQHSPWLEEIKSFATNNFIKLNKELEMKFIGNTVNINSYTELINNLPKKPIKKLTIISPYFDDSGMLLEQFSANLKIKELICLTDSEYGLLPIKLSDKLYKTVKFFEWKDCIKKFEEKYNRLHAKLFHFEFEDGWEYLLFGSANATINAFGSETVRPQNAEATILLRRKQNRNYIDDLGISTTSGDAINIKSFPRKQNNIGDSLPALKFQNRILYAEVNGDKLTVFLKENSFDGCSLVILNANNVETERHVIPCDVKEIKLRIATSINAYKIFLSIKGKRISTYGLIHNVALQAKCNPDPAHGELSRIIESLSSEPDNGQLIDLLKKADNWGDEEPVNQQRVGGKSKGAPSNDDSNKIYKALTTEQFNELSSIQSRELDLLNTPNVQIADCLYILSRGLIQPHSIFKENNEEALANQNIEEEKGLGEDVKPITIINDIGKIESHSINQYLIKVLTFFTDKLKDLHHKQSFKSVPKQKLTIKDLSHLSIALDLMVMYYGKQYGTKEINFALNIDPTIFAKSLLNLIKGKSDNEINSYLKNVGVSIKEISPKHLNKQKICSYIESKKKEAILDYIRHIEYQYGLERLSKTNSENKNHVFYSINSHDFSKLKKEVEAIDSKLLVFQKEYSVSTSFSEYLPAGGYSKDHYSGLKFCLMELLGGFLINSNTTAGYKHYNYDILNEKITALRMSVFQHGAFLCLNIEWNENEFKWRDILLLDLLHFIYPKELNEKEIDLIEQLLISSYEKAKYKQPAFQTNLSHLIKKLYPKYLTGINFYKKDFNDSVQVLHTDLLKEFLFSKEIGFSVLHNKGKDFIELEKPGIWWNDGKVGNIIRLSYPPALIKYYN